MVATRGVHASASPVKHCLSHNILVPDQTIDLGPFATLRPPGELHNTAKSAVRALDVVELLSQSHEAMRAVEIARAIGLRPSSADQLLKTLVDSAYLLFDPVSKRYCVSPRLSQMGSALGSAFFEDRAIERVLQGVHNDLGKQVLLMASQGSFMQVIDNLATPERGARPTGRHGNEGQLGLRSPLFGSSCGAVWLSQQTQDTIRTAISLCRRELGRQADQPERIFELIGRIRKQGFASGGVLYQDKLCGVSVPLPKAQNGIVLVLSVTVPVWELRELQSRIVEVINSRIAEFMAPRAGPADHSEG